MLVPTLLTHFIQSKAPAHEMVLLPFKVDLPSSLHPSKCVPMVILNPIRLIVKVNPHRVYDLVLVAQKQSLLAESWAFLP